MRTATICAGKDSWQLVVQDEALWADLWQRFYDALLTALGSPCCDYRHGTEKLSWTGWIAKHLKEGSKANGWLQVAQFRLMNNRLTRLRCDEVLRTPITEAQARKMAPDFVDQCIADDLAPKVGYTIARMTTSNATVSSIFTWTVQ